MPPLREGAAAKRATAATRAWVAFLVVLAVGLGISLDRSDVAFGNRWVVLGLAVAAALAERQRIRLSSAVEESVSLVPMLFTAVVFGPFAAMVVGAASYTSQFRRPLLKWTTYTCSRAITGAATGGVALLIITHISNDLAAIAVATIVAAIVSQALDLSFVLATAALRRLDVTGTFSAIGRLAGAAVPLYAPIVALLAYSYSEVSPWSLAFFAIPALAAQRLFVLYQNERKLAADLVETNARLERANLSFASALVATLDARDQYTAGHSAAVAVYARDIAAQLGLSDDEQKLAHLCGLVHDIGKIGLPPGLLEKPGALTLEERRQMETHSEIGERILAKVEDYSEIARIVRHHHERWDGQGYPDRIDGEDIPLMARILAVGDAYNAMTSDRPYRDAMPSRVARARLAQGGGSQFDSDIAAAFEAVLAAASEQYRLGLGREFVLSERERASTLRRLADVA
jgi:putative nucleotidyltransferase with HDIG domain